MCEWICATHLATSDNAERRDSLSIRVGNFCEKNKKIKGIGKIFWCRSLLRHDESLPVCVNYQTGQEQERPLLQDDGWHPCGGDLGLFEKENTSGYIFVADFVMTQNYLFINHIIYSMNKFRFINNLYPH